MPTQDYLVSPSGMKTWLSCKYLWALVYILKIRGKPSSSMQRGTALHAIGEDYMDGKEVDKTDPLWVCFAQALTFLPSPLRDSVTTERQRVLGIEKGLAFRGIVDLTWQDDDGHWHIMDYKSCSSLRWCMKEDELRKDIQARIYALFALMVLDVPTVTVHWMYICCGPIDKDLPWPHEDQKPALPKGKRCVSTTFTKDDLDVPALEDQAKAMWSALKAEETDLEKNFDHCGAYGGCWAKASGECTVSTTQKLLSKFASYDRFHGKKSLQVLAPETLAPITEPSAIGGGQNNKEIPMGLLDDLKALEAEAGSKIKTVTRVRGKAVIVDALEGSINPPEQHLPATTEAELLEKNRPTVAVATAPPKVKKPKAHKVAEVKALLKECGLTLGKGEHKKFDEANWQFIQDIMCGGYIDDEWPDIMKTAYMDFKEAPHTLAEIKEVLGDLPVPWMTEESFLRFDTNHWQAVEDGLKKTRAHTTKLDAAWRVFCSEITVESHLEGITEEGLMKAANEIADDTSVASEYIPTEAKGGFTYLVGCLPSSGAPRTTLTDIETHILLAEKEIKVEDDTYPTAMWRAVRFKTAYPVMGAILTDMLAMQTYTGYIVSPGSGPLHEAFDEVLRRFADDTIERLG